MNIYDILLSLGINSNSVSLPTFQKLKKKRNKRSCAMYPLQHMKFIHIMYPWMKNILIWLSLIMVLIPESTFFQWLHWEIIHFWMRYMKKQTDVIQDTSHKITHIREVQNIIYIEMMCIRADWIAEQMLLPLAFLYIWMVLIFFFFLYHYSFSMYACMLPWT